MSKSQLPKTGKTGGHGLLGGSHPENRGVSPVLLHSTVAAALAGCVSAFAVFWAGFCYFWGGPDGRVGAESTLAAGISVGFALTFAYASFLFYIAPTRIASGAERPIYHYACRAAPVFSILSALLLSALGGFSLLVLVAIIVGISILLRWIAHPRHP